MPVPHAAPQKPHNGSPRSVPSTLWMTRHSRKTEHWCLAYEAQQQLRALFPCNRSTVLRNSYHASQGPLLLPPSYLHIFATTPPGLSVSDTSPSQSWPSSRRSNWISLEKVLVEVP